MTDAMLHRGPDDGGHEIYEAPRASIGFGQRRLSILDLSPLGHQPMHFENLTVNFNGDFRLFLVISYHFCGFYGKIRLPPLHPRL